MNGVFVYGMAEDGGGVEEASDAGSLGALDEGDGVRDDRRGLLLLLFVNRYPKRKLPLVPLPKR